MSWFGGGGKKADKARKKQIASLEAKDKKSYNVYKLGPDQYRVTFRCRSFPDPLAIQIHLNDDFPDSPPKISVDRKYQHRLLDDNGVVTGLDELKKWSPHSDLGLIVQKITNLFNASTPIIKHNFPQQGQPPPPQQPPPQGGGPPGYREHMQSHPNYYQSQHSQHSQHSQPYPGGGNSSYPQYHASSSVRSSIGPGGALGGPQSSGGDSSMGDRQASQLSQVSHQSQHSQEPTSDLSTMKLSPPMVIPGFAQKTLSELEEMDKEHKLIKDFAYSIASTLREMKSEAQSGCISTAQKNIDAKDEISKLQRANSNIRDEVETLTSVYKELKKREERVLQKFSIPKILAAVDRRLDEVDQACEALKDKFETGDIAYVQYVKGLTKLRTQYHLLAIKKEKLQVRHGHSF